VSELIFTSGTEATPKAIMHTEQTTNFSVRVAASDLGITGDDVVWMPSPLGHSTGFNYGLRFALYHGLPLVLQDRWDAGVAVDVVRRERCTYTLAATTFLRELVADAARRGLPVDSLRCFGCGGAPVPPSLVEEGEAHGVQVLRLYGSTEVLVATWNRPDAPREARVNTDGRAMTGVEVQLRDGEIFTRGPNTCVGFFDDPERTAATFDADGWVRSGDLATLDGDGNLTIVGRKKELIIRGGMNITPRELEDLIGRFDEVRTVAVVGTPDERLGEVVCACVVLDDGATLTLETVVERLRAEGVATYKLPQRLETLPELPTTASGKIQKHEILRRLEERA
jgi:acyl-CoA synthetase (AMP-forming)/AMP-acid ligase II